MSKEWEARLKGEEAAAARYSDKAVRILQNQAAGVEEPRVAARPEFFECRMCRFRERCWRGEQWCGKCSQPTTH